MKATVYRGTWHGAGGPVPVAVKLNTHQQSWNELWYFEKLETNRSNLKAVIPILASRHQTAQGEVSCMQMANMGSVQDAIAKLWEKRSSSHLSWEEVFLSFMAKIADG